MKDRGDILITGAGGFIGRHLAAYFSGQGRRVIGVGHSFHAGKPSDWGISLWVPGTVSIELLRKASSSPAAIVHSAGGGYVNLASQEPYTDYTKTVDSLAATLEYARQFATQAKVLFVSSAAVYGNQPTAPLKEAFTPAPQSPYGYHRLIGEKLCESYATSLGLQVSIARLFSVFGPGLTKQLLWDVCEKAKTGKSEFVGTGNETRDLIFIDDAVPLLSLILDQASASCPIYNGGTGIATPIKEIVSLVHKELAKAGKSPAPAHFDGKTPTTSPLNLVASPEKSAQLPWKPTVKLSAGVEKYVAWYLRHQARSAKAA